MIHALLHKLFSFLFFKFKEIIHFGHTKLPKLKHKNFRCWNIFYETSLFPTGGSWRRGGEDKREERDRDRNREPGRDRDRDADGEKGWRTDKENLRRTKNETDDDGWTTVRR